MLGCWRPKNHNQSTPQRLVNGLNPSGFDVTSRWQSSHFRPLWLKGMAPNPKNKTQEEDRAQEKWVRLMQEAQMWSTTENGLKSWFHMCALTGRFAEAKALSIP